MKQHLTHSGRLLLLALALILTGCGGENNSLTSTASNPATGRKLKVVAATTQISDMARNVLGDNVELQSILSADADAHEYQPTADDARKLADADIILRNGVELESWLDKLIAGSGTKATIVDCSKGITLLPGSDDEPSGNPHIWFNPQNAKLMVGNMVAAVSAKDPANATRYQTNAALYTARIDELDKYIQQQWDSKVPNPADRKIVTNHAAFGYYVARYQLNFVGSVIPSIDTNYQPSAQELAEFVNKIKSEGVKAIFLEASVNPQVAEQIAKDAGVQVVDGNLYGDSLGPAGSPGETYLGMLRYDTDLLIAGVTGQPLPSNDGNK